MNDNPATDHGYQLAKLLYTHHQYSISEICARTGATEAAIRDWINKGKWDMLRKSTATMKETQLELLYDILEKHVARVKEQTEGNTKDADLLVKYTAAIKNLEEETGIVEIIEVAKLFCRWLSKRDLMLSKSVAEQFDVFISERLERES